MATTRTDHEPYPAATSDLARQRAELAPETHEAFQAFGKQVFADGALPEKTKQLIAVAVAHVTQCPTASAATPGSRCARAPPSTSSWRRSGSPQRCAPEARTRTPS